MSADNVASPSHSTLETDQDNADSVNGSNDKGLDHREGPYIVIYFVDALTHSDANAVDDDKTEEQRLATLGLMHCYNDVVSALPEHLKNVTQLQACLLLSTVVSC